MEIFISSEGRAFQLTSSSETHGPQTEDDLLPIQPADLDWLNLLLEEIQIKARTGAGIPLIELGVVEPGPDSSPYDAKFSKN